MARVLVVDDEDVLLEMIASLIEDLGYDCLAATGGAEALALLANQSDGEPPALVISDVMMPKINGLELTRILRSNPRYAHVPIILMSAAGRPLDSHGADYFVHKPFSIDMLADLIEQLISDQADTRQAS